MAPRVEPDTAEQFGVGESKVRVRDGVVMPQGWCFYPLIPSLPLPGRGPWHPCP